MRFDECQEGDYRIFVGALEAPRGDGYTAALVVSRVSGFTAAAGTSANAAQGSRQREAFRDDSLACGYRWPSADQAIQYAMNRARELIRTRSRMLNC